MQQWKTRPHPLVSYDPRHLMECRMNQIKLLYPHRWKEVLLPLQKGK